MTKAERNELIKHYSTFSDDELEKECYTAVYDCLGSQADIMEELCYDEVDIAERRKYEKWMLDKARLLEKLCEERGIELWKDLR